MKYEYSTSCVHSDGPSISDMVEKSRPIKYRTFRKYVDIKFLEGMLGYGKWLRIKDDFAVSFYRSKYKGLTCVYCDWSRIEHIFQPV